MFLRAIGRTGNVLKNWFVDPEAADYALGMIMKPLTKVAEETETDLPEVRDQEPDFPRCWSENLWRSEYFFERTRNI